MIDEQEDQTTSGEMQVEANEAKDSQQPGEAARETVKTEDAKVVVDATVKEEPDREELSKGEEGTVGGNEKAVKDSDERMEEVEPAAYTTGTIRPRQGGWGDERGAGEDSAAQDAETSRNMGEDAEDIVEADEEEEDSRKDDSAEGPELE
eukprot:767517-Hanusia_phi.AAC.2